MLKKDFFCSEKDFIVLIASIASLGGFLFGYDTGIIANAKEQITTQFNLPDFQWGMIISATVLGALVGALLCGRISDKIGRHSLILYSSIGFIIGSFLTAFCVDFISLTVGRFVLGFCIGIASFSSPLYISEISPAKNRGALVLLNGIALTAGEAISFLVGYFLHDMSSQSWRWMFLTGAIPAIALFVGMSFMPKSPRWLVSKNEISKAKDILYKIRPSEEARTELTEIIHNVQMQKTVRWNELFSKKMQPVLMIGLALGIFQQFSGVNTIMYYGPAIFKISCFNSYAICIFSTFIMGLVNTAFTIITMFLVDKIGRRVLMLMGTCVSSISLMVIGYFFCQHMSSKYVILFFMMTYIAGYCISVGSLFWLIISEIYPLRVRGLAVSFVTAIQWGANLIVAFTFLPLINFLGLGITFFIYAGMCSFSFLFTLLYLPETKGVPLEKIENNLLKGVASRDLGKPNCA